MLWQKSWNILLHTTQDCTAYDTVLNSFLLRVAHQNEVSWIFHSSLFRLARSSLLSLALLFLCKDSGSIINFWQVQNLNLKHGTWTLSITVVVIHYMSNEVNKRFASVRICLKWHHIIAHTIFNCNTIAHFSESSLKVEHIWYCVLKGYSIITFN